MLVVVVVVEVPGVLFDTRVDPERTWVNCLDSQVIRFKLAIQLALFVALCICDPHILDVCATYDVIPLVVRTAAVFLWRREEVGCAHFLWIHQGTLVPDGRCLHGEAPKSILEIVHLIRKNIFGLLREEIWKRQRLLVRSDGRGGSA